MEKVPPTERLRQRLESERQTNEREKDKERRELISKSLDIFYSTLGKYLAHLKNNEYPFAQIKKLHGEEFVAVELYDLGRTSDWEGYIEGYPLTLLIDSDGDPFFTYETTGDGYSWGYYLNAWESSPPQAFNLPYTIEDYLASCGSESPIRERKSKSNLQGEDLIDWSARMTMEMDRFNEFGFGSPPLSWQAQHQSEIHTEFFNQLHPSEP